MGAATATALAACLAIVVLHGPVSIDAKSLRKCVKSFRYNEETSTETPAPTPVKNCSPYSNSTNICKKRFFVEKNRLVHFKEAQYWCEEKGMQLVSIEDSEKWRAVLAAVSKTGEGRYWTSVTRDPRTGKFIWGSGCTMEFTNWDANEPNNIDGIENCLEILKTYFWNDEPCEGFKLKSYICESKECV